LKEQLLLLHSIYSTKTNNHDIHKRTFAISHPIKKPLGRGKLGGAWSETLLVTFQTLAIYAKKQAFLYRAAYCPFINQNQLAANNENKCHLIHGNVLYDSFTDSCTRPGAEQNENEYQP
jgi:hypothetical protein